MSKKMMKRGKDAEVPRLRERHSRRDFSLGVRSRRGISSGGGEGNSLEKKNQEKNSNYFLAF